MDINEKQIREDICEVGRRVWLKGWVAANDGNISMKTADGFVITTPTGVSKGFISPDMLVKVDMDGNFRGGYLKPSSEVKIHLEAYRRRDDIGAVLHAHPPVSTGYAVANLPLDFQTLPEVIISLGKIPLAKYGTPSTTELSDSIAELIQCHDAVLLANHGAMTVGKDVMAAYYKMECVEHFAHISLVAHQLGGMKPIPAQQVKRLVDMREQYGVRVGGTACLSCGTCTGTETCQTCTKSEYDELVDEITRKVMQDLNE